MKDPIFPRLLLHNLEIYQNWKPNLDIKSNKAD